MIKMYLTDDWSKEQIEPLWPLIVQHLSKIEKFFPDEVTTDSILADLLQGKTKLWVVFDGAKLIMAFTTEERTVVATGVRVMRMASCGGERLEEVLTHCMPELEQWARDRGNELIELPGRPGWKRMMRPYGFVPTVEIVTKRLSA